MEIPKIPNNGLTEEIKEIVSLCEQLVPEYGEKASWFLPPESGNVIKLRKMEIVTRSEK